MSEFYQKSAEQATGESAKGASHDLLEHLCGCAESERRHEVGDLLGIKLLPVSLTDVMHQPQLQRQDAEVGESIGKQFEGGREHRLMAG